MEEKTAFLEEAKSTKRSLQGDLNGPVTEHNAAVLKPGGGLMGCTKLATRGHAQFTCDMRRGGKKQDVQDSLNNATLKLLG